jgi:cation transport ATPase
MCKSKHPNNNHNHRKVVSQNLSGDQMKIDTQNVAIDQQMISSPTKHQQQGHSTPCSSPLKSTKSLLSSSSVDPFQETLRAKSQAHQKKQKQKQPMKQDYVSLILLAIVLLITIATYPQENITNGVNIQHVWYNGWITAVATGFGVLPFFFLSEPNKYWMGISNGKFKMYIYTN